MKKKYISPRIDLIRMDHDISLCLQSPPAGPNELPMPNGLPFEGGF